MNDSTKLVIFIIFWAIGSVIALLGNKKIREYRDYFHPVAFLIVGIVLSVTMSWAFVGALWMAGEFEFPKYI